MSARILVVAAKLGYQIRSFDEGAAKLGMDLRLATDRCHVLDDPWGDRAIPVSFDEPDAAALADSASGSFDGIIAVGDRPAVVAAHLAASLQIPFHPPGAVLATRSKFLSRECFRSAGMLVPEYRTLPVDSEPPVNPGGAFPCVLKPLGLSGSRGVIRANTPEEFAAAFRRICALLKDPEIRRFQDPQDRLILVEEFIPGREFAIEGVMTRGALRVLAIFDKPDPLDGPFFEETIYVTPSRASAETQSAMVAATEQAVKAIGLYHGPIHAEMRVNARGVWMLEVAARPIGGLCSGALQFEGRNLSSEPMSLEELLLLHAAGEDISTVTRERQASGVLMIPLPKSGVYTGTVGVESALAVPGITGVVITAKQGQAMLPLPEGSGYPGFLFARGDRPEDAERSLRDAHACLTLCISPALPISR